jgi:hypothetical protein
MGYIMEEISIRVKDRASILFLFFLEVLFLLEVCY